MLPVFRLGIALLLGGLAVGAQAGQYARDFSAQGGDGQALQRATDADICSAYLQNVNKWAEARGPQTCGRDVSMPSAELRKVLWQPVPVTAELAYVLARVRQPDERMWPESFKSQMDFSASWTAPAGLSYAATGISLNNEPWVLLRVMEQRGEACEHKPDGSGGRRKDRSRYYLFPGADVQGLAAVDPKKVADLQVQGSGIGQGYGDAFMYRGRVYIDKLRNLEAYSLTLSELSFVPYLDRPSLVDVCAFEYK